MAGEWHYAKDGQKVGPVSAKELEKLVTTGEISAETLVWTSGMENWHPLSQTPFIRSLPRKRDISHYFIQSPLLIAFCIVIFIMTYFMNEDIVKVLGISTMIFLIYTGSYIIQFGIGTTRSIIINSTIGLFGSRPQIEAILSLFDKRYDDYPAYLHFYPSLLLIMCTFLIYNIAIDLTKSGKNEVRMNIFDTVYLILSMILYTTLRLI